MRLGPYQLGQRGQECYQHRWNWREGLKPPQQHLNPKTAIQLSLAQRQSRQQVQGPWPLDRHCASGPKH